MKEAEQCLLGLFNSVANSREAYFAPALAFGDFALFLAGALAFGAAALVALPAAALVLLVSVFAVAFVAIIRWLL